MLSDNGGSGSLEGGLEALAWCSLGASNLGELNASLGEGARVLSKNLVWGNDTGLDDLD